MSNQAMAAAVKLDARAYPIEKPKGNTLAYATLTINDSFAVRGIKVMNSEKGLFAAMPNVKDSKGEYRDLFFPTTKELHAQIKEAVVSAYFSAMEKGAQDRPSVREQLQEGAQRQKDNAVPKVTPAAKTTQRGAEL